ncbi:MAG: hypothetical protein L3J34_09720 [Flavobacteriaceae bacterium]|nr:hypothetical protein [Flavobacteriaceae bacterium]
MIRKYLEMSFIKVVAISALLFFVVVSIIKFIIALFSGDSVSDILSNMVTSKYLVSNLIGALIYGLIITFYYKRKYKK